MTLLLVAYLLGAALGLVVGGLVMGAFVAHLFEQVDQATTLPAPAEQPGRREWLA